MSYDNWKLATPPEYEEDNREEDEEPEPQEPTEAEEFWNDSCWTEAPGVLG